MIGLMVTTPLVASLEDFFCSASTALDAPSPKMPISPVKSMVCICVPIRSIGVLLEIFASAPAAGCSEISLRSTKPGFRSIVARDTVCLSDVVGCCVGFCLCGSDLPRPHSCRLCAPRPHGRPVGMPVHYLTTVPGGSSQYILRETVGFGMVTKLRLSTDHLQDIV